ncbi:unnamed protein product [Thelazia callipaeda]|uniref:Ricin B-type lectin domain-containing protein n=1 Tax=Thelazia callipaeda TaxID=103827 RepID=A0A0N5CL73_THECL|nr:unnamed protein product [Thelazia callipaeda]
MDQKRSVSLLNALFLLLLNATFLHAGTCRSECLERNKHVIVRVHLKDNWAMVGLCKNTTNRKEYDPISLVSPFICDRDTGIWEFDVNEREGTLKTNISCPQVQMVSEEQLNTCPGRLPSLTPDLHWFVTFFCFGGGGYFWI